MTQEQTNENEPATTIPDEDAGIVVSSHLLIRDRQSGEVLVNQRAS